MNRKPTSSARIAHYYMKETTINFLLDKNPEECGEDTIIETVEFIRRYYKAEHHQRWKSGLTSLEEEDEFDV